MLHDEQKSEQGSLVNDTNHIQNILKPLHDLGEPASHEYLMLQKEMQQLDQKFRSTESFYSSSFSQVLELEKKISAFQNKEN